MSDIVERLRDIAEDVEPEDAGWCAVMREAADEIERLREALRAVEAALR